MVDGTPRHLADGWTLVEYEWDETTGVGTFVYAHEGEDNWIVERVQPSNEKHIGWYMRN